MSTVTITITLDLAALSALEDVALAQAWTLAQANPAPYGDRAADEAVQAIGEEIIRRWLTAVPPDLHTHHGYDWANKPLRDQAAAPTAAEVDHVG